MDIEFLKWLDVSEYITIDPEYPGYACASDVLFAIGLLHLNLKLTELPNSLYHAYLYKTGQELLAGAYSTSVNACDAVYKALRMYWEIEQGIR